ncbi:MAG: hypothetical protein WBR13_02440 [Allosphingosinicella sp.]
MTAKVSEAKRRAFLKAYAQSGNLTLSAEQAGVSKSWVSLARRGDPAFDAECRAAKAASAERLAGGGCNRPPGAWKRRGGVDLAVQRAGKRAPQVVRSLRLRWTPRAEARFLGELRRCNNIRLACARAGMTVSSYEAHWRRWPDFRRRVREARAFAALWVSSRSAAAPEEAFDSALADSVEAEASIAERINYARRHKGHR